MALNFHPPVFWTFKNHFKYYLSINDNHITINFNVRWLWYSYLERLKIDINEHLEFSSLNKKVLNTQMHT